MQSITFLVMENHGKIPSYNVVPAGGQKLNRGKDINAIFPSHGKPIIHMNQIQEYKISAVKGLTPNDPQFPLLPNNTPGVTPFWFIDVNEPRVDLSVYESGTDEYTNHFYGYSGRALNQNFLHK